MKRRPPTGKSGSNPARPTRAKGRLTVEEEALWRQVATSIAPLPRSKGRVPEREQPEGPRRVPSASIAKTQALAPRAGKPATGKGVREVKAPPPARVAPPLAGFEKRKARRIAAGRVEIEARIDLHGLYQSEAHYRLVGFIRSAVADGLSTVLVITGKGARRPTVHADTPFDDPDPRDHGVLRRSVPMWLGEAELRALVVSYTTAAPNHGGSGALYLHLRKRGGGRR